MAEQINYGESQAILAQRGVDAFNTASQNNIANVKAELDKVAAELAQGIQVGMTPEETAALNTRLNNLKSQAQTLTGQVQASYDFATGQSQTSQQEYNQQILAMQEAQRRATGQTLSQLQSVPTPGGYSSVVAENEENIRRQAAAEQAFMTGRGSVPAYMQRITPGLLPPSTATQGGVIGVSGGTQQLFQSALSSAQQSSLANLATSQLRIQQELESEARTAASDRETKQRDKYENFKISAINSIVGLTSEIGSKTAELEAAAASADTRTGKQIANAELDDYKKRKNIELANQLATIRASARAAGLSAADQKEIVKANDYYKGRETTKLGQVLQNRFITLDSLAVDKNTQALVDNNLNPYTNNGKDRILRRNGILYYQADAVDNNLKDKYDPTALVQIDANSFVDTTLTILGMASTADKKTRDRLIQDFYNNPELGLKNDQNLLLSQILLGKNSTNIKFWYDSFDDKKPITLDFGKYNPNTVRSTLPTLPLVQSKASIKLQEPIQPKGKLAQFTPAEKKRMAALLKPGVTISARK